METSLISNLKRLSNTVNFIYKYATNSKYLFTNFICINDYQSNISKTVNAFKILDQDFNLLKARSAKLFDKVQEAIQDQITKPYKVAEEIALFLSIRDQLSIQWTISTK